MVTKVENKTKVKTTDSDGKELAILDENLFFNQSNQRVSSSSEGSYSIRLDQDSYVWLFSGRRGGGKSVSMTFFIILAVILYNMRIISNFTIEFLLRRHRPDGKTYLQHIKSEQLDFEKLLMQDEDYRHVLIAIDESPDVISHLASITWKNRLINAFVRQLRHGFNSLFLAAQDESLIDKSLRWQIDIETQCQDLSRIMGDFSGKKKGEELELKWYDSSGQWTGQSTKDRLRHGDDPMVDEGILHPKILFGDAKHKAVMDSWENIDIMESLRRVDFRMSALKVGDQAETVEERTLQDKCPVTASVLLKSLNLIEDSLTQSPDNPNFYQKWFYQSLGAISDRDKNNIGKVLSNFNIGRGGRSSNPYYGFANFDLMGFKAYVTKVYGSREVKND